MGVVEQGKAHRAAVSLSFLLCFVAAEGHAGAPDTRNDMPRFVIVSDQTNLEALSGECHGIAGSPGRIRCRFAGATLIPPDSNKLAARIAELDDPKNDAVVEREVAKLCTRHVSLSST